MRCFFIGEIKEIHMIKSVKRILSQSRERYKVPRSVQDAVPVGRIYEDGIFQSGNMFSRCWKLSDINYMVASEEDKQGMFDIYSSVLNSLDSNAVTKITLNNKYIKQSELKEGYLIRLMHDGLDKYREEYNRSILRYATGANGIVQDKYMTISISRKSVGEARSYFRMAGASLAPKLGSMGSKMTALDADERLKVLHGFYRAGEENWYNFDIHSTARLGHSFKDYICPDSMEKNADYMMLGGRYARVFYLKDYANKFDDVFISELMDTPRNMMLSIDILPVPTDEAVRTAQNKLLEVETNAAGWQRKQNRNLNFSAVLPFDLELQRAETMGFLSDLVSRDQRMFFAVLTVVITADTKEMLEQDSERLLSIARGKAAQMAVLRYQQLDGLNTVLPAGPMKLSCFRTLNTRSLAVLMPFKVQEIMDRGGVFLGINPISHNLILCNREFLMNQAAIVTGVPGSGKSFLVKLLLIFIILSSKDDIIICDPEGEYARLIEAIGGDDFSVIRIAAGGRDRLNAMYMTEGYGEGNPIVLKSECIMSLIEQIDKKGVGPQHKSIIDRCIAAVYKECYENDTEATLSVLREKLLEQPEPEARQVALALELYTEGSLDIFGHENNVDLEKRIVLFDISGLGSQLKQAGLLVITDTMLNRVSLNSRLGKKTHIFIDEFHVVFENEYSAQFFTSAWRQFRKRNAYPTAITQNVEYLLDSVQASTMLSNSELVIMLNQAASDRERLAKLFNISEEQLSYITNAEPGCGLVRYGGALVPFENRFPKDTELYKLMTTKPGE